MVKCNNNYICYDDIITYEEIKNENTCVAIDNYKCSMCETINEIKNSNIIEFNKDPIRFIFGESKHEKNDEFWELLKEKCNIERDEHHPEDEYVIHESNYEELETNYNNIKMRLNNDTSNASKFISTMYKIAKSPLNIDKIQYNRETYTRHIKNILESDKCTSQIIHNANELPFSIEILFNHLISLNNETFCKIIDFLNSKPQLCLEAVIEKCLQINSKSKEYKKKYLKYKQKYLSLKFKKN